MKLRTISDSAPHSTSANSFARCAYTVFVAEFLYFKVTIFLILQNQSNIRNISIQLNEPRTRRQDQGGFQVPVSAASARAGSAPPATARFTADKKASNEAVMMLLCMPAPNSVRRERVVISI